MNLAKVLKEIFLPTDLPLQQILSRYVFVSERSEDEWDAFHEYVHNLTKKFTIFVLTGLMVIILFTWPTDYYYLDDPELINAYFYWRVVSVAGIIITLNSRKLFATIDRHFLKFGVTAALIDVFFTGYVFGSVSGFQSPWYYVVYVLPLFSIFLPLKLSYRIFLTVSLPLIWTSAFLIHHYNQIHYVYPGIRFNMVLAISIISIIVGHFVYAILRQNFFQSLDLDAEREKSDQLLHNTLPEPIVDRLKNGEDVSDRFDEVTVLFADLVEFTPLADELPPEEVVNLLDGIFSAFDDLTEEFGVEKIKTIGDEYFIAAGVPEPAEDHAVKCARYALAMQEVVNEYTRHDDKPFEMRIGMNTGSLVAGVIGNKRFVYDVWGDIVNVGSRMESQGIPGRIQVTPETKQAITGQTNGEFEFEERGTIEVKGKGRMTTYFLKHSSAPINSN